jgi:hypothetical protein
MLLGGVTVLVWTHSIEKDVGLDFRIREFRIREFRTLTVLVETTKKKNSCQIRQGVFFH